MWSQISHNRPPRAPSAGLISHHQNPKIPRTKSCRRIQANRRHPGGRTASPAALPAGKTRRWWCWLPSALLSPGGPPRRHGTRVLSLPLFLEGQPATQKGCVGVGVWEVFQGHQLVSAGRPHPTHTPLGHLAPLSAEHHPGGGLSGCSLKLRLLSAAAAAAEGGGGKTQGAVLGLEHPHTAASPGIPPVRRRPPIISQPRPPDWLHLGTLRQGANPGALIIGGSRSQHRPSQFC